MVIYRQFQEFANRIYYERSHDSLGLYLEADEWSNSSKVSDYLDSFMLTPLLATISIPTFSFYYQSFTSVHPYTVGGRCQLFLFFSISDSMRLSSQRICFF